MERTLRLSAFSCYEIIVIQSSVCSTGAGGSLHFVIQTLQPRRLLYWYYIRTQPTHGRITRHPKTSLSTHTHTHTHARTHARTHAHTRARARTHTHTQSNDHKTGYECFTPHIALATFTAILLLDAEKKKRKRKRNEKKEKIYTVHNCKLNVYRNYNPRQGSKTSFRRWTQPLLWAVSWAARVKITLSGISNRLYNCNFLNYIPNFKKVAAGSTPLT